MTLASVIRTRSQDEDERSNRSWLLLPCSVSPERQGRAGFPH